MYVPKKSEKINTYNKLEELQKMTEAASSKLSSVVSETEKVKIEKNGMLREMKVLESDIEKKKKEIIALNKEESDSKKRIKQLAEQYNEIIDTQEDKKKDLEFKIVELENKLSQLEKDKKKFDKLTTNYITLLDDVSDLEDERDGIIINIDAERKDLDDKREKLNTQKIEILGLIKKKEKLFVDTERNLADIQILGTRLQQYYDEHKIPLDVRKQFNLK